MKNQTIRVPLLVRPLGAVLIVVAMLFMATITMVTFGLCLIAFPIKFMVSGRIKIEGNKVTL
jgi:hypothetical protein